MTRCTPRFLRGNTPRLLISPVALSARARCWRLPVLTSMTLSVLLSLACHVTAARAQGLNDLISLSMLHHPDVAASESNRNAAAAEVDGAWQNLLPTPSVAYNTNVAGVGGNASAQNSTVALQQPMWWFSGTQAPVYDAANARLAGSEASMVETRDNLANRVLNAYGTWLNAVERIHVATRDLGYYEGLLEQIGRRVDAGTSAGVERSLVTSRRLGTQGILANSQASAQSALDQLTQLVGQPLDSKALLDSKTPAPRLPAQDQLLRAALARNPTLARLDTELSALSFETKARQEVLKPQLYLRAESAWVEGAGTDQRLSVGVQWSPGAGLSSLSAVNAAAERVNAARFSKDSALRHLNEQVSTAYAQYKGTYERLTLQMQSYQTLIDIRESYLRQFMAGRRQWQEVMNTVRDVSDAQYTIADLRASLLVSGYQVLLLAHGDGDIADVPPLDIATGEL